MNQEDVIKRLPLLITAPIVIIFTVIMLNYKSNAQEFLIELAESQAMSKAEQVSTTLAEQFNRYYRVAFNHAHDPMLMAWFSNHTVRDADLQADPKYLMVHKRMMQVSQNDDNILSAFYAPQNTGEYFFERGIVGVAKSEQDKDYFAYKRPWYLTTIANNDFYIGNPSHDLSTDRSSTVIRGPVYNDQKKLVGVAGIELSLQHFKAQIRQVNLTGLGFSFVINAQGALILFPKNSYTEGFKFLTYAIDGDGSTYINGDELNKRELVTPRANHPVQDFDNHRATDGFNRWMVQIKENPSGVTQVSFNGEDYYLAYHPLPLETQQDPWTAVFLLPKSYTTDETNKYRNLVIASIVVFTIVVLLLTIWLRRRLQSD